MPRVIKYQEAAFVAACTVDLESFEIKWRIAEREIREALGWVKSNQSFLLNELKTAFAPLWGIKAAKTPSAPRLSIELT